jgi:methyl-accepting chemotaxis protein
MRFKDLPVSKKLVGVFTCILVVTAALGLFAVSSLSKMNDATADIATNWMPAIADLGRYEYFMTRYRVAQGNYVMATTDEEHAAQVKNLQIYLPQADENWNKYLPTVTTAEEKAMAEKIVAARAAYDPMQAKVEEILKTQGKDAAIAYFQGPMKAAFSVLIAAADDDMNFNQTSGKAAADKSQTVYGNARLLIFIALALAIAFCAAAGYALMRAISAPLRNMTTAMGELAAGNLQTHVPHADQADEIGQLAEAMTGFKNQLAAAERAKEEQTQVIVASIGAGLDHLAKGNLTHRVAAELTGDFAKLKRDFNEAMTRLQDTMKKVLGATTEIETGAGEISQAADDLSRRTEQQAASLEETAAALEEITATVKKTAANAKDASHSVTDAKAAAEDGGRVVETAIHAMDSIAQSSRQITDIIGVIDEIAFQTNLLALNAGVEAARAGEAGKGFAVVASEVRALAQRSSEAAKQIKALIQTSGQHVDNGVKFVGESGEALKRIVDQVLQINALVSEMAMAAEQQSTGIEQVNAAVSQMDQVTQQNAAMVEQSTAASRNLAGETKTLSNLVGFFAVGETARAAAAPKKPYARQAPQAPRPATGGARRVATSAASRAASAAPDSDWTEF